MSTRAAAAAGGSGASKPRVGGLDADFHESTHSRMGRAMSTRRLVTNRHDDLLRSGSTHQLLNRPHTSAAAGASLLDMPGPPPAAVPAGVAESLATEDTAQDTLSDSEGSEFSGGSFCEAEGDSPADRDYLRKDLGASLHDDELEFDSGDDKGGDDLIADVKNRMNIDEDAAAKKETS